MRKEREEIYERRRTCSKSRKEKVKVKKDTFLKVVMNREGGYSVAHECWIPAFPGMPEYMRYFNLHESIHQRGGYLLRIS
jgi:hypothetical protein